MVRPANKRAEATVRRIGMDWVGKTGKYYDLRLQVFRLRPADVVRLGRTTFYQRAQRRLCLSGSAEVD